MKETDLIIALPNKGRLSKGTIDFLEECSLYVKRDNERQYHAEMKGLRGEFRVVFQRAHDIPKLLKDRKADLGITGLDIFCETSDESIGDELVTVFPDTHDSNKYSVSPLPYGQCDLVIAVPDHWVDVSSVHDLPEREREKREKGERLRIATGFHNLTRKFLLNKGLSYFQIIDVHGAAESAPRMGIADLVSDLKSSGVTMMENRLKQISDGTILRSSACLIASKGRLKGREAETKNRRLLARQFIDRIEAHLKARKYCLVTANIEGDGVDKLLDRLREGLNPSDLDLLGQEGPTVANVCRLTGEPSEQKTYSISIQIEAQDLEKVIEILRSKTGRNILVSQISFVYDSKPEAYSLLEQKLKQ